MYAYNIKKEHWLFRARLFWSTFSPDCPAQVLSSVSALPDPSWVPNNTPLLLSRYLSLQHIEYLRRDYKQDLCSRVFNAVNYIGTLSEFYERSKWSLNWSLLWHDSIMRCVVELILAVLSPRNFVYKWVFYTLYILYTWGCVIYKLPAV